MGRKLSLDSLLGCTSGKEEVFTSSCLYDVCLFTSQLDKELFVLQFKIFKDGEEIHNECINVQWNEKVACL